MEEIILKIVLSAFIGALIGLEREYKKKGAGLRTFSLVCLGTCIFTILTFSWVNTSINTKTSTSIDPTRVIQAIATGIGFIGAGVIFQHDDKVKGLTTAASLWVTSAIGIAIGAGFYYLAVFSSILTIIILSIFALLEDKILKTK